MIRKKKNSKTLISRLFNFIHSIRSEERIRCAVVRLNKLIIAEGLFDGGPFRVQRPATNPFSPPHNTPQSLDMRLFLKERDSLVLHKSEAEAGPEQDEIHIQCLKTDEMFLLAEIREGRSKTSSHLELELGAEVIDYTKNRNVDRAPPIGIESFEDGQASNVGASFTVRSTYYRDHQRLYQVSSSRLKYLSSSNTTISENILLVPILVKGPSKDDLKGIELNVALPLVKTHQLSSQSCNTGEVAPNLVPCCKESSPSSVAETHSIGGSTSSEGAFRQCGCKKSTICRCGSKC